MDDVKMWSQADLLAVDAPVDNGELAQGYCADFPPNVMNLSRFAPVAMWLCEQYARRVTALKAISSVGFAP